MKKLTTQNLKRNLASTLATAQRLNPATMEERDAVLKDAILVRTQLRLHQIILSQIMESLPVKHEWIDP